MHTKKNFKKTRQLVKVSHYVKKKKKDEALTVLVLLCPCWCRIVWSPPGCWHAPTSSSCRQGPGRWHKQWPTFLFRWVQWSHSSWDQCETPPIHISWGGKHNHTLIIYTHYITNWKLQILYKNFSVTITPSKLLISLSKGWFYCPTSNFTVLLLIQLSYF